MVVLEVHMTIFIKTASCNLRGQFKIYSNWTFATNCSSRTFFGCFPSKASKILVNLNFSGRVKLTIKFIKIKLLIKGIKIDHYFCFFQSTSSSTAYFCLIVFELILLTCIRKNFCLQELSIFSATTAETSLRSSEISSNSRSFNIEKFEFNAIPRIQRI